MGKGGRHARAVFCRTCWREREPACRATLVTSHVVFCSSQSSAGKRQTESSSFRPRLGKKYAIMRTLLSSPVGGVRGVLERWTSKGAPAATRGRRNGLGGSFPFLASSKDPRYESAHWALADSGSPSMTEASSTAWQRPWCRPKHCWQRYAEFRQLLLYIVEEFLVGAHQTNTARLYFQEGIFQSLATLHLQKAIVFGIPLFLNGREGVLQRL